MGSFCKLLGLCSFSPFCLLYSVLSSVCAVSLDFFFGSLFVCHSFFGVGCSPVSLLSLPVAFRLATETPYVD